MEEEKKQKSGSLKGIFKGIGGVGGWFSSLLGKPRPYIPPSTGQEEPKPKLSEKAVKQEATLSTMTASSEEDSIVADIEGFKKFVGKTVKKVSIKTTPVAEHGAELGSQAVSGAKQLVDKSFLKKLVRVFLILVFLIILVFIALRLFKILQEDNGEVVRPPGVSPSPIPYEPYKPSVYAGDPEVLQLEEDINILEAELTNTNIREERLFPPSLDFNVRF